MMFLYFQLIFQTITMRHPIQVLKRRPNWQLVHIHHVTMAITIGPIMCSLRVLLTSIWAVCVSTPFNYQQRPTTSALVRPRYVLSQIVMVTTTITMIVLMIVAQNRVPRLPTPTIRRKENTVIAVTVNSSVMEL